MTAPEPTTPMWEVLTSEQMRLVVEKFVRLSVNKDGTYVAREAMRAGRGRSPRQAIEAMR